MATTQAKTVKDKGATNLVLILKTELTESWIKRKIISTADWSFVGFPFILKVFTTIKSKPKRIIPKTAETKRESTFTVLKLTIDLSDCSIEECLGWHLLKVSKSVT